ncbi:MAG: tetratricopeptide repeat protein [Ignavibacteria bacterium]|nr:tetratricopeptide repeat protein [Ignavibacteria bacterium]
MAYDISDFEKEVIERSYTTPVLVDFWADWCGPCKVLGPVLERLTGQSDGRWTLAKVNTEEHVEVARKYNIQSIPNVKLFVDGVVANEFVGALPEYQVQRWLETAIPSKHRRQIEQAEVFLLAGNLEAARVLLEEVLSLEPGNVDARIFLARSIVFTDPAQAAATIGNLDEPKHADLLNAIRVVARLDSFAHDPGKLPDGDVRELYHSAIQHLAAGDFDTAVGQFIEVIRENRSYDDDGSRKACIAVFKLLGEEHRVTQKHRRDFSSALY